MKREEIAELVAWTFGGMIAAKLVEGFCPSLLPLYLVLWPLVALGCTIARHNEG